MILPIVCLFSSEDFKITLLDIHDHSLLAAKNILDHFGYSNFIQDYLVTDAVTYRHPIERRPHIIIVEVMQEALTKEPQVAITGNLGPQLRENGIFIPSKVHIDFGIETATDFSSLKRLLSLSPETVAEISEPIRYTLPNIPPLARPVLLTTIELDGDTILSRDESGLTFPKHLQDLTIKEGDIIEFQYRLGDNPGFSYRHLTG